MEEVAAHAKENQRHREPTRMRQERARRLLESNKGDDFRTGCGTLPDGLRDRVCALEALAVIGAELYRQRKVEAVRGPWIQEPGRVVGVAKPSKNKARRIRARRLKELERRQEEALRGWQGHTQGVCSAGGSR